MHALPLHRPILNDHRECVRALLTTKIQSVTCVPVCITCTGGGAAADVTAWCEFHNGVAAGIKVTPRRRHRQHHQEQQQQRQQGASGLCPGPDDLAAAAYGGSSSSSGGPDSLADTWLPHSKPYVPNYAHAGVLLALGLRGHLDRLSWTDLYR